MEKGYIKLSRKFFSTRMWEAARTFSECEAWLDLIQSARFEATVTIERIGGRDIKYGRGQFPASNRFLAKRWGWGEQKVKTFLVNLKKEKMITSCAKQGMSVITLVNYETYNSKGDNPPINPVNNSPNNPLNTVSMNELEEIVTQRVTQQITQLITQQPSGNPKKKKEKNKDKETTTKVVAKKVVAEATPLAKRKNDFYESLIPFTDKYSKQMLRDFFEYWSEMNRSKTKMRFEGQKTWETAKRLITWAKREEDYAKNKSVNGFTNTCSSQRSWTNADTEGVKNLINSVRIG